MIVHIIFLCLIMRICSQSYVPIYILQVPLFPYIIQTSLSPISPLYLYVPEQMDTHATLPHYNFPLSMYVNLNPLHALQVFSMGILS